MICRWCGKEFDPDETLREFNQELKELGRGSLERLPEGMCSVLCAFKAGYELCEHGEFKPCSLCIQKAKRQAERRKRLARMREWRIGR